MSVSCRFGKGGSDSAVGVWTHLSSRPLFSDDSKLSWKESFFLVGIGSAINDEPARLGPLVATAEYISATVVGEICVPLETRLPDGKI